MSKIVGKANQSIISFKESLELKSASIFNSPEAKYFTDILIEKYNTLKNKAEIKKDLTEWKGEPRFIAVK